MSTSYQSFVTPGVQQVAPLLREYAPVVGEVGPSFGGIDLQYPVGDIRRYGRFLMNEFGGGNASLAFAFAITNALALKASTLVLPMGTFTLLDNVVVSVTGVTPKGLRIRGYGRNTILMPGPTVTRAITISGDNNSDGITNLVELADFFLDGVNATTAGCVGIVIGDGAPTTAYAKLRNIGVFRFATAGGANIWVKDSVGAELVNVVSRRGETGLLISSTNPALPTATTITGNSQFSANTKKGIVIAGCDGLSIEAHTVMEQNGEEGFYAVPAGTTNALGLSMVKPWFEANNVTGGTYDCVIDGSGTSGTVEADLWKPTFRSRMKSLNMKKCNNSSLVSPKLPTVAATVLLDNNQMACVGWPDNNAPFPTTVSVLNGTRTLYPDRYRTFTDQQPQGAHLVVDVRLGNKHLYVLNTNAIFTVDAPINSDAMTDEQIIKIQNVSGVALGAATWAAGYNLSEAWVNPATGFTRVIRFIRNDNSAKWDQSGAATVVAN